jgi:hypothetical protein
MWPRNFADRLSSWCQLREKCSTADLEQCLTNINQWWFRTPWVAYSLHWDDRSQWPDPWQLLAENHYCSLARGLGMLYTIALLDRGDLLDVSLIETDGDNLVHVHNTKYILNWDPGEIVNINPGTSNMRHCVGLQQVKKRIT